MLFLSEDDIAPLLRFDELIPAIELALTEFSLGRVVQPVRSILVIEEPLGWFGLMPAIYGGLMGAKLVTFFPGNSQLGLHTHMATVQLFDAGTGAPLAIMDGRLITEMRTAAVSAVATRALASSENGVLTILGSGVQARSHFDALSRVAKFSEVRVWSRNQAHAEKLASEIEAISMDREKAVRDADVVVTVTSSAEPIVCGEWLKPDAFVCAVGAVGASRRELDDETVCGASVVVESRDAALRESGEIIMAGVPVYAEIGEILAGVKPKPAGRIVFKSTGIAVEDLAAAKLVYDSVTAKQTRSQSGHA